MTIAPDSPPNAATASDGANPSNDQGTIANAPGTPTTKDSDEVASLVIEGVVTKVVYRNDNNGYSVLQVKSEKRDKNETVVGTCFRVSEGDNIVARGSYRTHNRYGPQFVASVIENKDPDTLTGIRQFLTSKAIKGVGAKTIDKVIDAFGLGTIDAIYHHNERLSEVVGPHKAKIIAETYGQDSTARHVLQFLLGLGIGHHTAHQITARYGQQAPNIVQQDPYRLAREVRGVGFRTADNIALSSLRLPPNAPQRLRGGLIYALEKAQENGHCFLERGELIRQTIKLLGLEEHYFQGFSTAGDVVGSKEIVELGAHLDSLLSEGALVADPSLISNSVTPHSPEALAHDVPIALPGLAATEQFIAEFVSSRIKTAAAEIIPAAQVEQSLTNAQSKLGIVFSDEQRQAVLAATKHRLLVVTGGPGCGKTTVIRALASLFDDQNLRLFLAAPTGRAAQRMGTVCDLPAQTIHRLLKFRRGEFVFGPNNPLPADAVIIDESSMVDAQLARSLFSAIPHDCSLILVGDKDQLPSVGPGKVFHDIIECGAVPTIFLSHIYRRAGDSSINDIACQINCGIVPPIPTPDGQTKAEAYFLPVAEPEDAAQLIERLVSDQIPRKFGIQPHDILVLTPSNRGPLGTEALNLRLQARLNPLGEDPSSRGLSVGGTFMQVGDRVIQRVNNYNIHDAGVFNGDSGVIFSINGAARSATVELWDGRLIEYQSGDLSQLSLAYCLTIHRAQGSEIPCVILVMHETNYAMLERQLAYTGVTRAKQLLIIVGTRKAFAIACRRASGIRRKTTVVERIRSVS